MYRGRLAGEVSLGKCFSIPPMPVSTTPEMARSVSKLSSVDQHVLWVSFINTAVCMRSKTNLLCISDSLLSFPDAVQFGPLRCENKWWEICRFRNRNGKWHVNKWSTRKRMDRHKDSAKLAETRIAYIFPSAGWLHLSYVATECAKKYVPQKIHKSTFGI